MTSSYVCVAAGGRTCDCGIPKCGGAFESNLRGSDVSTWRSYQDRRGHSMLNWIRDRIALAHATAREGIENARLAVERRREDARNQAAAKAERARIDALKKRYWADFQAFEEQCLLQHRSAAERQYSTQESEADLTRRTASLRLDLNIRFGDQIAARREQLRELPLAKATLHAQLALFERSYKTELAPLYDQLKNVSARLEDLYATKTEAHARLKVAKGNVEAWHSKSKRTPWLFGNSGKRLPKHSVFGQSFGDLDGYKADRGAAVRDLERVSGQIAVLESSRRGIVGQVSEIKACRQQMFDLRVQGMHPGRIKREVSQIEIREQGLIREIAELTAAQAAAYEIARNESGIAQLEQCIADRKAERTAYLSAFYDPQAKAARKSAHRNEWIIKHGNEAAF